MNARGMSAIETAADASFHGLFKATASRVPEDAAVVFGDRKLTYLELDYLSDQLAESLAGHGVGPEVVVGIHLERSLELAISLLGVLKAGGACLPLDPRHPNDRRSWMAQIAGARLILDDVHYEVGKVRTGLHPPAEPHERRRRPGVGKSPAQSDNLAFIFFTSGSTGTPKGVMISHAAGCSRQLYEQRLYGLGADDRFLMKSSISFDNLVREFFWPFICGGAVVMAEKDCERDVESMLSLIRRHRITAINFLPSMLDSFLEHEDTPDCGLRHVFSGGEPLTSLIQKKFHSRLPSASLHNIYGPTEAFTATYYDCDPGQISDPMPIGRPTDLELLILDEGGRAVSGEQPGEIYIGGTGLARGYINQPKETAERFVDAPAGLCTSRRLYRTGDIAYRRSDGNIVLIGRRDNQVKVRGFRLELEEVEAALQRHPSVRRAAARLRVRAGEPILEALLELLPGDTPVTATGISKFLAGVMPDFMIPSRYFSIDRLPQTSTGKLDRALLRLPDNALGQECRVLPVGNRIDNQAGTLPPRAGETPDDNNSEEPQGDTERALADIWRHLLEVERISRDSDFFGLGGTSLTSTKLLLKIAGVFRVSVGIEFILQYPTLRKMGSAIERLPRHTVQQTGPSKADSEEGVL